MIGMHIEKVASPLVTSAQREEAWAKALYEALLRYEPTPLYEATAAELGDVLAVARLAS